MENATKKSLKTTYKLAKLGFTITLPSCITKEGLGWKHNKSDWLLINTTRVLVISIPMNPNYLLIILATYIKRNPGNSLTLFATFIKEKTLGSLKSHPHPHDEQSVSINHLMHSISIEVIKHEYNQRIPPNFTK